MGQQIFLLPGATSVSQAGVRGHLEEAEPLAALAYICSSFREIGLTPAEFH